MTPAGSLGPAASRSLGRVCTRSRVAALGLAFAVGVSGGCVLKQKKKSGHAGGGTLLVEGSVYFDRIGDGDVGRLTFKTTASALCEMAYYSQVDGGQPPKGKATIVPCSEQTTGRTDFTEKIPGLKTDQLYNVVLSLWPVGQPKSGAQNITVKETPRNGVGGTGSDATRGDGTTASELMVARFDVALRTAEVHRAALATPLDTNGIKTQLTRTLGCVQGPQVAPGPFVDAKTDAGIQNLATTDFAAGNATAHPDYPGRLKLVYPGLNVGADKWSLLYLDGTHSIQVPIRPVPTLSAVGMESTTVAAFDTAQLSEAADPVKLDLTKPLKMSWTTGSSLLDLSYMTVQVGRPDYDNAITCVFAADKRAGEVPAAMLAKLDDGRHVVTAELSTSQYWIKDAWVVTTTDWRAGRVEK